MATVISRRVFLAAAVALAAPLPACSGGRARILGGYWPAFRPDIVRLADVPEQYNLVYLFACVPSGTAGEVVWHPPGDRRGAATHLVADIEALRAQGRSVVLTVGGAGAGMDFDSRAKSQVFLRSVGEVIGGLGGVDGLDLNTFEAGLVPNFTEYAFIGEQLKSGYGADFTITVPPAPWNEDDKVFCRRMAAAGLLDFCAPQFYDGPGLARPEYVLASVAEWVGLVGAERLGVGFGIDAALPDFMTTAQCVETWRAVTSAHPDLRGAYLWSLATDHGWGFARQMEGLL